jgi:hypothetical protein
MTRKEDYQHSLQSSGISLELSIKAAEILDKDDPNKSDLGRSKEDQEFVANVFYYLQLGANHDQ